MAQKFKDAARGELVDPITTSSTSIEVTNGNLFSVATVDTGALSSGDWFKAVLQDDSNIEIVYVRTHELVTSPNLMTNVLRGQDGTTAKAFPAGAVFGIRPTAGDMDAAINGKVDKVAGKGLSTENYSTADKDKLAGIAANATSNASDAYLLDRAYHTNTQAISTIAGLQTALDGKATAAQGAKADTAVQPAALGDKVDKVAGKGLSTEDYSSAEKTKLSGISAGAQVNTVDSVAGKTGAVTLAKADVGLGSVDNTSDAGKPISTATQTALDSKAPINATLTDAAAASTLPATTSTALTALLQTVRDCLKWLLANTLQLTGNQTVAGIKTFTSRSVHAGAYTASAQPAHSATPTFDCATSNVFEPAALTGNVTSITLSNAVAGQTVQIRFQQDATGGRTVAVPSGAKVDGSINTTANRVSWLILTYSARGSRWEGNWLVIPS